MRAARKCIHQTCIYWGLYHARSWAHSRVPWWSPQAWPRLLGAYGLRALPVWIWEGWALRILGRLGGPVLGTSHRDGGSFVGQSCMCYVCLWIKHLFRVTFPAYTLSSPPGISVKHFSPGSHPPPWLSPSFHLMAILHPEKNFPYLLVQLYLFCFFIFQFLKCSFIQNCWDVRNVYFTPSSLPSFQKWTSLLQFMIVGFFPPVLSVPSDFFCFLGQTQKVGVRSALVIFVCLSPDPALTLLRQFKWCELKMRTKPPLFLSWTWRHVLNCRTFYLFIYPWHVRS